MKEPGGTFEMPISMVMAMAESSAAMAALNNLPRKKRAEIIERARAARCPAEMNQIISGLTENKPDAENYGVRGLR